MSPLPVRQPNIVLCLCDQLRAFEVGCYGNSVIRTPNIDRLAREGVRFEHAVTNNPVCMPARSCLLSGQYSRTCAGNLGNIAERDAQGNWVLPEYPAQARAQLLDPTLPEELKLLGYETALIGKWHVQPAPGRVGFDHAVYPRVHHRYTGQTFVEDTGSGKVVDGYSVDYEAGRVADFLHDHKAPVDRPFFLFYSISPPHMPLDDAPERYKAMYRPEEVPLRPNVYVNDKLPDDEHWFKVYLWDFLYYQEHLPHTKKLPPGFDLRHLIALYYGMTTWVDDMVGRLMAELAKNGLADDTIVVFLSDHGDNLGSHHLFNKDSLVEESIRIPMIFHAPGRWSPRNNVTHVASLVDVMPTLLETCGGRAPSHAQGRSLAPILSGATDRVGDGAAFVETSSGPFGVRTPTHLYGAQVELKRHILVNDALCFYDLQTDPYEKDNLLKNDPQLREARAMREQLLDWNRNTPWLA